MPYENILYDAENLIVKKNKIFEIGTKLDQNYLNTNLWDY